MRSNLLVVAAGLVLGASCSSSTSPYGGGGGAATCTPTPTEVCMIGTSFSPMNRTVPMGTTVTWKNGDPFAHTVTSATASPGAAYNSGSLAASATFSHTFTAAGTYPYYCMIHGVNGTPPTGMHGTITVTVQ
jgi:plastocyanin